MNDVDPWKIWAGTGLLLALIATGTEARLRDSSTLTAGDRRSEAIVQDPSLLAASSSFLSAQSVDDTQGNEMEFGFSFGLRRYSQPVTEQAILNYQIVMPRAPIFEDATFPEDDILTDPGVQVASRFPILSTEGESDDDISKRRAAVDLIGDETHGGIRLARVDYDTSGTIWEINGSISANTERYTMDGSTSDLSNTAIILDGSIAVDLSDIGSGFIPFDNSTTNVAGELAAAFADTADGEAIQTQEQVSLARQLEAASLVTGLQEASDANIDEGQLIEAKQAILQATEARLEEARVVQAQADYVQQVNAAMAASQSGRILVENQPVLGSFIDRNR